MKKYKIKDENLKRYNQKSSGGSKEFNKKWINGYNHFFSNVFNDVKTKNYEIGNGKYLIEIVYKNLQPKTSRYKFRKTIHSIEDIPQRDTRIYQEGNQIMLSVVYQLKKNRNR